MNVKKILYKSFDKNLNKQEETIIDQELSASDELKKEKQGIIKLRELVSSFSIDSFGNEFVNNVMAKIKRVEEKSRWKHVEVYRTQPKFSFFKLKYTYIISVALLLTIMSPTIYSWLTTTTYLTQRGDVLTVTLPDNSQVKLNSESKISFLDSFGDDSRLVFLEGEAYFDVQNGKHPFTVKNGDMIVQVLGTQFNVYAREQSFEIAVNEGIVKVGNEIEDNFQKEVVLTAGQIISFDSEEHPGNPQIISNSQIPGWIHNKFIFAKDNLEDVCKEIERKFDIVIDLANSELGIITVTGVMEADNLSDVLATISLLTKRPYKFEKQRYIFY